MSSSKLDFTVAGVLALWALAAMTYVVRTAILSGQLSLLLVAPLSVFLSAAFAATYFAHRGVHGRKRPQDRFLPLIPLIAVCATILASFATVIASPHTVESPAAILARAEGWLRVRNHDAALAELNKIPSPLLDANLNARFLRARGRARYYQSGEYELDDAVLVAALSDLIEARKSLRDNADLPREIASILGVLGAFPEAEAMFAEALMKDKDPYWPLLMRAAFYRERRQYDRAAADIAAVFARENDEVSAGMPANFHRGLLYFKMERYEEAAASFMIGLRGQSDYPYAYFMAGCAYARARRYADAIDVYTRGAEVHNAKPIPPILTPAELADNQAVEGDIAVLQQLAKTGSDSGGMAATLCEGFWQTRDANRERSPLLPAAIELDLSK